MTYVACHTRNCSPRNANADRHVFHLEETFSLSWLRRNKRALFPRFICTVPPIGCFISDKFSNFEKLTWIGVSNTLKTILIFFLIFKFKFRGLPLKKTWKKNIFCCIFAHCAHTILNILKLVHWDTSLDVFHMCTKFEHNRRLFRGLPSREST